MDLIHLLMAVCALSTPDACEERAIPSLNQIPGMQCVPDAPLFLAQWMEVPSNLASARWRCTPAGIEGGTS